MDFRTLTTIVSGTFVGVGLIYIILYQTILEGLLFLGVGIVFAILNIVDRKDKDKKDSEEFWQGKMLSNSMILLGIFLTGIVIFYSIIIWARRDTGKLSKKKWLNTLL